MCFPSEAPRITNQTAIIPFRTILNTTKLILILILTFIRAETLDVRTSDIRIPFRANLIASTFFHVSSLTSRVSRKFSLLDAASPSFLAVSLILYNAGRKFERKSFRFWITSTSAESSFPGSLHIP